MPLGYLAWGSEVAWGVAYLVTAGCWGTWFTTLEGLIKFLWLVLAQNWFANCEINFYVHVF